jgi:hypothetical protein
MMPKSEPVTPISLAIQISFYVYTTIQLLKKIEQSNILIKVVFVHDRVVLL